MRWKVYIVIYNVVEHIIIVPFSVRLLLAYIMIPIVQKEIDTFVDVVWNSHRIRDQKNT